MSLLPYLLGCFSLDLIQTIQLVTPASGILNEQQVNPVSDPKMEDAIYIESSFCKKNWFSVRLAVMLQAAYSLNFAEI